MQQDRGSGSICAGGGGQVLAALALGCKGSSRSSPSAWPQQHDTATGATKKTCPAPTRPGRDALAVAAASSSAPRLASCRRPIHLESGISPAPVTHVDSALAVVVVSCATQMSPCQPVLINKFLSV